LQGPGASTDKEIPVPPPQESKINFDQLYPAGEPEPTNFIRFSQTVEECIGCQYDMTEDDDVFLKAYNQKRAAAGQLSEDVLEQILDVFENTASLNTPFAKVDQTVIAYDHMVPGLSRLDASRVMQHAKDVYEYWKEQRQAKEGPLHPSLKFEVQQERDDLDPYVCFRRREVRQTRKTRARDVQSAEKLKRLRRELEDGRQLVILSYERELMKRELLTTDRLVFEQRARVKEAKVRLGIKTDDEDLYNVKVRRPRGAKPRVGNANACQPREKRKAQDLPMSQRGPATLRMPVRPDGRAADADLRSLADLLAEKENELRHDIQNKIDNHIKWNSNHIDVTRDPLTPVKGPSVELSFRPAKTQYLMTPPASAEGSAEEPTPMDLDKEPAAVFQFRGVSQESNFSGSQPSFRRRYGRLGRLWIDRRGLPSPPREPDANADSDRWKYDQDDSEDEPPTYEVDPFDTLAMKFRATIPLVARDPRAVNGAHTAIVAQGARPPLPAAAQPQPPSAAP